MGWFDGISGTGREIDEEMVRLTLGQGTGQRHTGGKDALNSGNVHDCFGILFNGLCLLCLARPK